MRADRYIIEHDSRDKGGGLLTIMEYDDWASAWEAWKALPADPDWRIQLWLIGVTMLKNRNVLNVIDFKSS